MIFQRFYVGDTVEMLLIKLESNIYAVPLYGSAKAVSL
jgi:hypothetical protein